MSKEYRHSILFLSALTALGLVLQVVVGEFDVSILRNPLNLIALLLILWVAAGSLLFRERYFVRWFSGVPFSVTQIGFLLVASLLMGLIPQTGHTGMVEEDVYALLGLRHMTASWPFVLLYFILLLSLGMVIARKLHRFRLHEYTFYLNHIGLWIILLSAGLGAADMATYTVQINEGESLSQVSANGRGVKLPFSIRLEEFSMEEYPPRLAMAYRETGNLYPPGKPRFFQLDSDNPKGNLLDWEITMEEYMPSAILADDTFRAVDMPGASEAAKITAFNKQTGERVGGWLYRGNARQLPVVVLLNDSLMMVMMTPEPKKYSSVISVAAIGGESEQAVVEVNKPYRWGNWTLYQYGYDTEAGKHSRYSVFQIVYDPWVWGVYVGIVLLAVGSVGMVWSGNKKRRIAHDVE